MRNKGEKNPMYGKKHTEETKRKIALSRKKYTKENHPSWKGGKRINHNGYVEVRMPEHPRAQKRGYVFEHILVIEQKIGRTLKSNEQVHHINKIRTDNRPENLQVIDIAEHTRLHSKEKRKGKYVSCFTCGKEIYRKPSHVKEKNYCSSRCVGKSSKIGNLNKKLTNEQIVKAIKENGTPNKAARKLGVSPSTVYRRIKKIGDVV